uniref:Major facilitator superfamily (MFS) profile domain-containing protein n=1 Tax=Salix viminalis TaxID=40686 RepID=A0A6N2MM37_SALVM
MYRMKGLKNMKLPPMRYSSLLHLFKPPCRHHCLEVHKHLYLEMCKHLYLGMCRHPYLVVWTIHPCITFLLDLVVIIPPLSAMLGAVLMEKVGDPALSRNLLPLGCIKGHLLMSMLATYVEGRDEVDRGASHQTLTQDFFISGKRKREDFAPKYNNGGFIPQQDGAGDSPSEVAQVSQGNTSLGRCDIITTKNREILACASTSYLKIPQVDGPIPDPYEDMLSTPNMYTYQGAANEDYNIANTPAPNDLQASTPAVGGSQNDVVDDDDDEPLNEDDDDDEDLDGVDQGEELSTQHLILAQFDKVTRTKSRWKCTLKDGIMHINNKDILFNKVQYSAEEGAEPLATDATIQEVFSWSSVILPFFFPALGGLLFGYDIGATSGAALSLQSPELSGISWFNLSAVQLGLVVSGSLYGALLGSILVYPISDFLGRRRELITAALLYAFGGLLTSYAPGLNVLLLGRLVYGLGIGLAMHGAPLYIAETCPSQIRGTLISLKELFIVLGILVGFLVGSIQIDAVGGWRYMYGFGVPIALLMGLGMWSLPPSPRWLLLRAAQGKGSFQEYKEKAISALSKLRGRPPGDKVSEKQIEESLVSLKSAYKEDEPEGSFLEVFQGPSLKAFVIGGGLVLFQQITGQPSVLYYAGPILQSAGFSAAADATRVSVVIGLFKLAMTWIAVVKVDDLGRRPLLIGGVSGIALSLFLLSAYYKFLGGFPLVAVAALLLYISFGPISWLMVSEIFPLRTRGRGISLAVLTNFGSNAIVTFAFSPLKEFLGAENLFLLFGAIALLSLVFVVVIVPETKGLSLEEIEPKILK